MKRRYDYYYRRTVHFSGRPVFLPIRLFATVPAGAAKISTETACPGLSCAGRAGNLYKTRTGPVRIMQHNPLPSTQPQSPLLQRICRANIMILGMMLIAWGLLTYSYYHNTRELRDTKAALAAVTAHCANQ